MIRSIVSNPHYAYNPELLEDNDTLASLALFASACMKRLDSYVAWGISHKLSVPYAEMGRVFMSALQLSIYDVLDEVETHKKLMSALAFGAYASDWKSPIADDLLIRFSDLETECLNRGKHNDQQRLYTLALMYPRDEVFALSKTDLSRALYVAMRVPGYVKWETVKSVLQADIDDGLMRNLVSSTDH